MDDPSGASEPSADGTHDSEPRPAAGLSGKPDARPDWGGAAGGDGATTTEPRGAAGSESVVQDGPERSLAIDRTSEHARALPLDEDAERAPDARSRYHHGDLRAALLRAGEAELSEHGVEAFSLRRVARRAGVSHAAPAHHFGDARGLLTALAAEGFRRFLATQGRFEAAASPDPDAQLMAAAEGYLAFAREAPALFRLMFASDRPDGADPDFCAAAGAAFAHLVDQVSSVRGAPAMESAAGRADVTAAWAMVHGIATLDGAGRLGLIAGPQVDDRAALLRGVFARSLRPA